MRTSEFLKHLEGLKIRVWSDEGQLRVSAPKGALTPELKADLGARKEELLALLASAAAAGASMADAAEQLPELERVSRTGRNGGLTLSFPQQRLWFLQRLEPDLVAYNIPMAWVLTGALDAAVFERAIQEIVRRHESLRTSFVELEGVPAQVVKDGLTIPVPLVTNTEGLPDDVWWRRVMEQMTAEAERPFDLEHDPLLRVGLYRTKPGEHVMHATVHHIVFDGISMGVFLNEVLTLYDAFAGDRPSPLRELPVQYADYAVWQRRLLEGPEYERQVDYWKETLGGRLPVLELPTDRPRPAIQTYAGDQEEERIPGELVEALGELAKREGVTLYMVLLAAYKTLLLRYTGQTDVVVGTAINGRNHPDVEGVIGFFVNTLAMRTGLEGDPTFRELLKRVRDVCLGGFEHKDVPFERVVDEIQPERSLAYSPVFQTLFFHELDPAPPSEMDGLSIRSVGSEEGLDFRIARNDLCFWISYDKKDFVAWAEYNTDLFDADRIRRLLRHYRTLLEEVARDPERPLSKLPLLPAQERERVLRAWNATEASYPDEAVFRRFEEQADRTPDAAAVVFPSTDGSGGGADLTLSYAELDAASNKIAHRLVEVGVAPDALVGLCLERSAEMIVAQLAIQKAGAAYVPLDPSYPVDRLAYMAEDSGLAVVVTQEDLRELVPGDLTRVCVDTDAETIAAQSADRLGLEVPSTARMYVIYTSGSTGRPKGVELEHRSVSNFLSSMALEPGLSEGDRLLAVTTLSFDISVLETMLPLMVGGTVIVAPFEAVGDGQKLKGLLARLEPQVMQATPATWRLLGVSGWEGDLRLKVLCGGEALPRELADDLLPRCRELWNVYGPTEATIWSTLKRVEPDVPITIGHPIANTQVYVLDPSFEPCPIGVPGELWIAGDGLARGYLNRPELTAERFLADPFVEGNRMYRTGDLARWTRDGELECLGRIDNQVKLRGFRIELGEIESVLADAEAVRQVVCVVREDSPGDQRLVAYLVPEDGAEVSPDALKAKAGEHLPGYMVPQSFVELSELPHTPNGKVDRNALLALEAVTGAAAADEEHVAPKSDLERRIASIWSAALKLEQVSVATNFFDLGGHSLLLAQVHARLVEDPEVGAELSILELFQYPTVASLAEHLAERESKGDATQKRQRSRDLQTGRKALMRRRRARR